MTEMITIGDYTVTVLRDGSSYLPPSFYPGADFSRFPGLLGADGTYEIRLGAHLVRGPAGTFLIDAGAGELALPFPAELAGENSPAHLARAGNLPAALTEAGVTPGDIDAVLITHLHLDHVGWIMKDGAPYFPNAVVHYGAEDWALLDGDEPTREIMEAAEKAGVLRPYGTEDLPGVRVMSVPGHTPGHVVIELASGGRRLWFTGDLLQLPGQLTDRDIHFVTDADRGLATAARARLLAQAKREGIVIAAAHLGDPSFRLIAADDSWIPAR
ncbi:MBL fold metallo-hydrolase [Paractinoplanes atraurantiacus]|uniref:Glyoxylase, beta-lactamase superfamily II n=1 Tax=Paractinoplanes atraurantiacus TaxID=1036182 RepID=A0A285K4H7_9ACTN|nr:MBL fold metallo-hydrolase [Actinoplanes atraurantiacus]SNY67490.1 Glyoxylase, beta-lactamase superfamily II [Actinoplanes atraurantiacus]